MFNPKKLTLGLLVILLLMLSGCMYPEERYAENQIPPDTFVRDVQSAIDRYYQENKLLPIKTKPADTPVFEKYVIEFNRLVPRYLASVPPNVFEKGGPYYYVLINIEEKPTVKLLDLRVTSKVADVQQRVDVFLAAQGHLPIKDLIGPGYYAIDYEALKSDPVYVRSVYSGAQLPLIMNASGKVGVDYRIDLAGRLEKTDLPLTPGEDIRYLLTRDSMFVPVKSFPYTIDQGEPVFMIKK
ncbi:MAG: hypothetical protein H0Z33_02235 [Bacillaceae bacterium]|nr:hypothetical protein [Bacillaceae bacterium]